MPIKVKKKTVVHRLDIVNIHSNPNKGDAKQGNTYRFIPITIAIGTLFPVLFNPCVEYISYEKHAGGDKMQMALYYWQRVAIP